MRPQRSRKSSSSTGTRNANVFPEPDAIIVADCLSFGFSNSVTDNNPDGRAIDYANVTAQCCAHIRSVIISHGAANIDPNTIAIGISDSDTHDDAD